MKLPDGLTAQQIRVMQEFRRKAQEELTSEEVGTINHPGGGDGAALASELVQTGFLEAAEGRFRLTERGKQFLARPCVPLHAAADGEAAG